MTVRLLGTAGRPNQGRVSTSTAVAPASTPRRVRSPASTVRTTSTTGVSRTRTRHFLATGSRLRPFRQSLCRPQLRVRGLVNRRTSTSATSPACTRRASPSNTTLRQGTAALAYLAEHYPDATEVVVVDHTGFRRCADLRRDRHRPTPRRWHHRDRSRLRHWRNAPDFNAEILGELWGRLRQHARLGGQRRLQRRRLGSSRVLDPSRTP
jgi:hypothetical protein